MVDQIKDLDSEKSLGAPLEAVSSIPSVTEEEKELAANAYDEFQAGNYDGCKGLLKKLQSFRSKDPKVMHNKAVSDYFASGFIKTEQFRKKLNDACKLAQVNLEKVDALDDVNHCVMLFNQAVMLFHLHQYHSAISILDKLFQFIEPIDEHLARRVCFLLLELYLSTHQPEKALGLVGYVENMLFGTGGNSSKREGSDGKTPTPEKETKEKDSKEISDLNPNENHRPKLQHYKARCYIMLKSTKACKREIKSLMNSGVSLPAIFLRSQLEYLRGNHRKSLKVLNTAFISSSGRPYAESGDNLETMYYNNMGCIHFYMGKPSLGIHYTIKAMQSHHQKMQEITKENTDSLMSRPIHTLDSTARYQLLYNLGMQYLLANKPQPAFDCLVEATQAYHTNPRLWLRIAECCILAHKMGNPEVDMNEGKKNIVQSVLGKHIHRKIVFSPHLSNHNKLSPQDQTSAMPSLSLEFASLCLINALHLLPEEPSNTTSTGATSEESEMANTSETNFLLPVPPANSLQKSEASSLRNSILAASAYIGLCLGDIIMALKHAENLLIQPRLSGAHCFLSHLYAAEALVLLDRIGDAMQHLNPELIKDVNVTLPPGLDEKTEEITSPSLMTKCWHPSNLPSAKVVLLYNLAVAYTLRGELDKASETLKLIENVKTPGLEKPPQAIMLEIYIQLHQGHTDLAKTIIKEHLPQYR